MGAFKLILDNSYPQILEHTINIFNKAIGSISYEINDSKVTIVGNELQTNKVFQLGALYCHICYNWNRNILERIKLRDEVTPWGKAYFTGSEDEKIKLNAADQSMLVDFSADYFESFIKAVRSYNNEVKKALGTTEFNTDLNNDASIKVSVEEFNDFYGTDFKIKEIYLDDQLYFAKIEFSESNLIDVFCLGYAVALRDEKDIEKMRIANLKN